MEDYIMERSSYLWWAEGYRSEKRTICFQTESFVSAVNTRNGLPVRFAPLCRDKAAIRYGNNDDVFSSPELSCSYTLHADGKTYTLTADDAQADRTRILEQGSLVQHTDCMGLTYLSESGERAPITARNDFRSLPDRFCITAEFIPNTELHDLTFEGVYRFDGSCVEKDATHYIFTLNNGERFTVCITDRNTKAEIVDNSLVLRAKWHENKPGNSYFIGIEFLIEREFATLNAKAEAIAPYCAKLRSTSEFGGDVLTFHLYDHSPYYDPENNPNMNERIRIHLSNPSDKPACRTLCFAKEFSYSGVPGVVPSMHDADGVPNGIYVQLSKNWHSIGGCRMPNQGVWLHLFTHLELPPHTEKDYELRLSFAKYCDVFAASHAQLCLVGWGTNQLWDQCAIGCFGECITYDPDVNLNRSMVDDVRPMFVSSRSPVEKAKWGWTENVGGNDFLVYFDENGTKQYITNVKTTYTCHGPLLTSASYTGVSGDGAIRADITVQTGATEDMNRAFHTFRYEALRDVTPTRISFYQMGADHYNNHTFDHTSVGDKNGKIADYDVEKGGLTYRVRDIDMSGDDFWVALYGQKKGCYYMGRALDLDNKGAVANRGLAIRSYRAVINGKVYTSPTGAIYGTMDSNHPSSNFELTLPPEVTQLHAGDVIEGCVEYFIPPQFAEDYYGSNLNLLAEITAHPDSWEAMHREATGNSLRVTVDKGELINAYPLHITASDNEASWSVCGGLGYVHFTVSGLSSYRVNLYERIGNEVRLLDKTQEFRQVIHANGTYTVTWCVDLDTTNDTPVTRNFIVR